MDRNEAGSKQVGRRGFLSMLGIGAAVLTLDPDKALWVPGKKLISIPRPNGVIGMTVAIRKPYRFVGHSGGAWQPEVLIDQFEYVTIANEAQAQQYAHLM